MVTSAIFWAICIGIAVPVLVLAIECVIGSLARAGRAAVGSAPPVSVLMPAHNEAGGISKAITDVMAQLRPGDELIVIADNCSDQTAEIAERLGATVVAREDTERRGKGYALDFGRAHAASDPRRVMVILDADCSPQAGAIQHLAAFAAVRKAVVQGAYLLEPPAGAGAMVRLSCFAFVVKNLIRQRALRRLAGSALLQGAGMAFPYPLFSRVDWRGHSLVEDLELGLNLLLGGEDVLFDDAAMFVSEASSETATVGQRRRWEHGALMSMRRYVPRLVKAGFAGRPRLLVLALDQMVPPTAVVVLAALGALLVAVAAGAFGPALLLLTALLLLASALTLAWARFGRSLVPIRMLRETGRYLLWKAPIALQFITRRERSWIRTERQP